jgi:restriction system protein
MKTHLFGHLSPGLFKEERGKDMARRRGIVSTMLQIQRAAERQRIAQSRSEQKIQSQKARQAIQAKNAYEQIQAQIARQEIQARAQIARQEIQDQKAQEQARKEQAKLYTESRIAKVNWQNEQLELEVYQLTTLLAEALTIDSYVDLNTLKQTPNISPFNPGALAVAGNPPILQTYLPPEPSGFQKFLPGTKEKHAQNISRAHERYNFDLSSFHQYEYTRQQQLVQARAEYEKQYKEALQQAEVQNKEIAKFQQDLQNGLQQAINDYFTMVLASSNYPDNFPKNFKLAYLPESKQLAIEYDIPPFDIIPGISAYKYIKTKDAINEIAQPLGQRKELYNSIIAQITLRTLYELFKADRHKQIEIIVFNGHVSTINKSTGHTIRPCLITLRTSQDIFTNLNLKQVDPVSCLKALNAGLSKGPEELIPIRPVLDFNMIDPRFVEEADVISSLDQRPNLMELSPSEFESLITNLFAKMGLETRQTRASRDGGVDCVAYDPRPVIGGKIVIQAKRYKDTVGVSAVRDLYGTVMNEGASKGILVATSGYGKAAFEFVEGKPLELLSGSNLLALLAEHASIEAKIIMPDK